VRIFVDTNIIISAILFPDGKVASVFSHILESHDVIISSYSIIECETVFNRKFPDKTAQLQTFFTQIEFELFNTPKTINSKRFPALRDVNDLPILASAILCDADILLTGDKDFEDIKINKPLIFTPNQYFDLLQSNS